MGKKNKTKSVQQKAALKHYYDLHSTDAWEKHNIEAFSREIGLTPQQVYKWLWDRRNAGKITRSPTLPL